MREGVRERAGRERLSAAERALIDALRGLRFGSVEAVVHDGRIARIERKEKLRLEPDPTSERLDAIPNEPTRTRPDRRSSPESQDWDPALGRDGESR